MIEMTDDADDDEAAELRAADVAQRRYNMALCRHPDCRDPDHPGCSACQDDET